MTRRPHPTKVAGTCPLRDDLRLSSRLIFQFPNKVGKEESQHTYRQYVCVSASLFIRAPHIFGVRYTLLLFLLKPLSLSFFFVLRGGGGGGWLQHALASC
jgi:hypothetical protein